MNLDYRLQFHGLAKRTMFKRLNLIHIGPKPDYPLGTLRESIGIRFPMLKVEQVNSLVDVTDAYYPQRDQYHSTRILAILEKRIDPSYDESLLGVTSFDLFVPGMNFVFGEARLPGRVGIISTHRLKSQSPDDPNLLRDRVIKEAVHEIGHMLGLRHCPDSVCVMRFSEHIQDTDHKHSEFCKSCQSQLQEE
jgi:archaemetzincin